MKRFHLYLAYFGNCSRRVSWLINRSFTVSWELVFIDLKRKLCVLDITIEGNSLCFIRASFFQQVEAFLTMSWQVVLVGDWNAILDPNLAGLNQELTTKFNTYLAVIVLIWLKQMGVKGSSLRRKSAKC